ncbi:MAG: preprotein translocase subunit SecG [Phycisphaerales bacterium]
MILTLGLAQWAVALLVAAFLVVCVVLILTILIQRPQGGGLSGAFGSNSGSGQTAFGAKTGDALTIATIGMFVVYVLFAIGLNYVVRPSAVVDEPPAATGTGAGPSSDVTTVPMGDPPASAPADPGGAEPASPEPAPTDPAAPAPAPAPAEPAAPPVEPTTEPAPGQ